MTQPVVRLAERGVPVAPVHLQDIDWRSVERIVAAARRERDVAIADWFERPPASRRRAGGSAVTVQA